MARKPREMTNRLLEMVEEGLLDRDTVIMACVKYMSEDDVGDMMRANEFIDSDEDDEDEAPELGEDFFKTATLTRPGESLIKDDEDDEDE